jgi:hypothetical protein
LGNGGVKEDELHTSAGVNGQLTLLVDGSTKTAVIATGIITLRIAQWVIDVLSRLVAPQALCGDLELASAITNKRRYLVQNQVLIFSSRLANPLTQSS